MHPLHALGVVLMIALVVPATMATQVHTVKADGVSSAGSWSSQHAPIPRDARAASQVSFNFPHSYCPAYAGEVALEAVFSSYPLETVDPRWTAVASNFVHDDIAGEVALNDDFTGYRFPVTFEVAILDLDYPGEAAVASGIYDGTFSITFHGTDNIEKPDLQNGFQFAAGASGTHQLTGATMSFGGGHLGAWESEVVVCD